MEKFPSGSPLLVQASDHGDIAALMKEADSMGAKALDELPFGMIQLELTGKILRFNKTEASLARISQEKQIGKNFFEDVAPCTRVKEFYGRFTSGVAKKNLYETFGFVFKFAHGPRTVAITMMYSAATDTVWVLVSQAVPR